MAIRFLESRSEQNKELRDATVRQVYRELDGLSMARGSGAIGTTGEIAIVPTEPYPVIDPITGESEEPAPATEYYRVGRGMALGSAPLRRKRSVY